MKRACFVFAMFLLFGCLGQSKVELSQEEIAAQAEAARKTDSLLNSSKKVMDTKNLTQSFSGVHNHLTGSGNLAFDAHQDPEKTRRMIRNYAILAEKYKANAPKAEEARRKMIESYMKSVREEEARIY
jgi:hypothetical protein